MNWLMRKLFGRGFLTHECQQADHMECPGECRCCAMECRCACHKTPSDDPVQVVWITREEYRHLCALALEMIEFVPKHLRKENDYDVDLIKAMAVLDRETPTTERPVLPGEWLDTTKSFIPIEGFE